jgi:large subunit ribosomal protein L17
MRHGDVFRKLSRTTSERRQLFQNQITSLIRHERIETTLAKAKELRRVIEKIITKARSISPHVSQGKRLHPQAVPKVKAKLESFLKKPEILEKLYGPIATRYAERTGGYTRIWRLGQRKGDAAKIGLIELIDSPFDMKKAFVLFEQEAQRQNSSHTTSSQALSSVWQPLKELKVPKDQKSIPGLPFPISTCLKTDDEFKKSFPLDYKQLRKQRSEYVELQISTFLQDDLKEKKRPGWSHPIQQPYISHILKSFSSLESV